MTRENQRKRLEELAQKNYPTGRIIILDSQEFAIRKGILWPKWKDWPTWTEEIVIGRSYEEAKGILEK